MRLALAIENRYADFQGSGLRLRFSSVSATPLEKIAATAFSLKIAMRIFNSACFVFSAVAYLTYSSHLLYNPFKFHYPRFSGKTDVAGGTAWGEKAAPDSQLIAPRLVENGMNILII